MARGSYALAPGLHGAGAEGVETFSCAPGPAGWRYVGDGPSGHVDLLLDGGGRLVRGTFTSGAVDVRAGEAGGILARRGGQDVTVAGGVAVLTGSPGTWLALLQRVRPGPDAPVPCVVLRLAGPALAPTTQRLLVRWADLDVDGDLRVKTFTADDADTGERTLLHRAGDVLLAAEGPWGSCELAALT